MRKAVVLLTMLFLIGLQAAFVGCKKTPSNNCTAVRVAVPGIGFSHNNGQECQNCHFYQGFGTGCFNISGSVYKANKIDFYAQGEIRLFTQPNGQGQQVGTFYVDSRGNFYSTAGINWSQNLFATFNDGNGNNQHMQAAITSGDCNSCHGDFNDRIFVP